MPSIDILFCFHQRTIKALWRTRILNPYQKEQITEEHDDQEGFVIPEDSASVLENEENMSRIFSAEVPIRVSNQLNKTKDRIGLFKIILCVVIS